MNVFQKKSSAVAVAMALSNPAAVLTAVPPKPTKGRVTDLVSVEPAFEIAPPADFSLLEAVPLKLSSSLAAD